MAENDFEWMRRRAQRTAALFDGFRLDHLVGLYRTYIRPLDPQTRPFFAPPDEASQLALGERLVAHLPGERRRDRSPRISAPCPISCARSLRRTGRAGLQGAALGAPLDRARAAVHRSVGVPTRSRSRRPARTTPSRSPSGGSTLPADDRDLILALPSVRRHLAGHARRPIDAMLRALLGCGFTPDHPSGAGPLRLARSHQHAGRGRRDELDVAPALAGRSARAIAEAHARRVATRTKALARAGQRAGASASYLQSSALVLVHVEPPADGRFVAARLATTIASSAGCTGLAMWMLNPAPSTCTRSAALAYAVSAAAGRRAAGLRRQRADPADERIAVFLRHLDVADDDVRAASARSAS